MMDRSLRPRDAAEWFLTIQSQKDPEPEILQAWLRWLEASEENRQSFEDVVQIWHGTPAAMISGPDRSAAGKDYDGSVPIAQWRAELRAGVDRVSAVPARPAAYRARRRHVYFSAAAAVVAAVGLLSYRMFHPAAIEQGEFVTRTAEQMQLRLADGSDITLGAHSRLSVDLQSNRRDLRLSTGEAYFSVHKDPMRPFVVRTSGGSITAVGTAFNVRAVEDRVTVTVTQGSVKVTETQSESKPGGTQIGRGQQLTFTRNPIPVISAASVKQVDADESARWREGWLVYRDEPLKYVVADIARYTDIKVDVVGAAAEVRFSGAVFKDNIDEWLVALPEVAAVSVERETLGFKIESVQ